jgi:hypothetical protein
MTNEKVISREEMYRSEREKIARERAEGKIVVSYDEISAEQWDTFERMLKAGGFDPNEADVIDDISGRGGGVGVFGSEQLLDVQPMPTAAARMNIRFAHAASEPTIAASGDRRPEMGNELAIPRKQLHAGTPADGHQSHLWRGYPAWLAVAAMLLIAIGAPIVYLMRHDGRETQIALPPMPPAPIGAPASKIGGLAAQRTPHDQPAVAAPVSASGQAPPTGITARDSPSMPAETPKLSTPHIFAQVSPSATSTMVQVFVLARSPDEAEESIRKLQATFQELQKRQLTRLTDFGPDVLLFGVPAVSFETRDRAREFCNRLTGASVPCTALR